MNSQVTVSLDSAQAGWHDSGLVLPAGWGLACFATGTAQVGTAPIYNTTGSMSLAVAGAAGSAILAYPEGYYQQGTSLPHSYQPWAVSAYNIAQFAANNTALVCANLPPYCVAVLVQTDGAAAPSSTSAVGAQNAYRQRQFSSGELNGGAGGRVWLLYNDAASDRSNNVGSFSVKLESLQPPSFATGWTRAATLAYQAWLQSTTLTLAACVRVLRTDGVVLGFTSHDDDIILNGEKYEAGSSVSSTAFRQEIGNGIDNMDIFGLLQSDHITDADLRLGKYDSARIRIMLCNWSDLTMGYVTTMDGLLGMATLTDGQYKIEVRSQMQVLTQQIGELTSPTCRVRHFCDSRCKLNLADYTDPRAYVTTTNNLTTRDTVYIVGGETNGLMDRDNAFKDGLITFSSTEGGLNAGITRVIKSSRYDPAETMVGPTIASNHQLILQEALPFQPGYFDICAVTMGCDRLITTCSGTYNNVINFRGEPNIPGTDLLQQRGR